MDDKESMVQPSACGSQPATEVAVQHEAGTMVNTQGANPEIGEWNDSLTGDFAWGNANNGEAMSCVMTSFTWSVMGMSYDYMNVLPGYPVAGNIAGRPYQNGTVMVSALKAIGKDVDAIVARELGIPAVVGCGDATTRVQMGDGVLVDGAKGVVELVEAS